VMSDVDAILRSGTWADRLGHTWEKCLPACWLGGGWWSADSTPGRREDWHLTPDQMRLRIVRDLHRAECPGLAKCEDHPVPYVVTFRLPCEFRARSAGGGRSEWRSTFEAAIAAAHNMTGDTQ